MVKYLFLIVLIPIAHFILAYYFAVKEKILTKLKRNYAIMYLDWLFIFVNLSILLNNSFSTSSFWLFFLICVVPIIHLKTAWRNSKNKRKETTLFFTNAGKLNRVGIVHTAFMLIQGTISLQFFFSKANSNNYFIGLVALFVYFAAYCLVIKYVRKLKFVKKVEMSYVLFGLFLVLVRAILAIIELN